MIYQFHMPFFFFVSGIFIKEKDISKPRKFILRQVRRLWLPYVYWNLFFLFTHNYLYGFGMYSQELEIINGAENYLRIIVRILLFSGRDQLTGQMWFIVALFLGSIIYVLLASAVNFILHRKKGIDESKQKYNYHHILLIGICSFILFLIGVYVSFPYGSLNQGLIAVIFLFLGQTFGERISSQRSIFKWYYFILAIVFLMTCAIKNPSIDIANMNYANPFIFVIGAIAGIYCILFISYNLSIRRMMRVLLPIGENTMIIMVLHLLAFKILSLIFILFKIFPNGLLSQYPTIDYYNRGILSFAACFMYTIFGVFLPVQLKKLYTIIARKCEQIK